jgi:hypothetical protein
LLLPDLEVRFRDLKQADSYVFHPFLLQIQVSGLFIAPELITKVQLLNPRKRNRYRNICETMLVWFAGRYCFDFNLNLSGSITSKLNGIFTCKIQISELYLASRD